MSQTIKGLTHAGQAMKARLEAHGVPFKITRIVAGAAPSDDPLALTKVPSPKQEFTITMRLQKDASAILHTKLTNESLKNPDDGYSLWMIGIYAESPDTPETLYRVIQFASPRPVPPYTDGGFSYAPVFYITTANSDLVTVMIDPDWSDEAASAARIRAEEAYILAEEALAIARESSEGGYETISDIPPENSRAGDMWFKPLGKITGWDEWGDICGIVGGMSGIQPVLLSGVHLGEDPPASGEVLWLKPRG